MHLKKAWLYNIKKKISLSSILFFPPSNSTGDMMRRKLGLVLLNYGDNLLCYLPVCCMQAVVPSSSGGDLETPFLMVKLIGHSTFQTFSDCLFSTRKAHNAACCRYKELCLSLICTSHLSRPQHQLRRKTSCDFHFFFSILS